MRSRPTPTPNRRAPVPAWVALAAFLATVVLTLATLVLLSRPGQQNLLLGQGTLEVVLGCYLALVHGRRRPALALALAAHAPHLTTGTVGPRAVDGALTLPGVLIAARLV